MLLKKTNKQSISRTVLAVRLLLLLSVASSGAQAATVWSDDFESLTTGDLVPQDGWSVTVGATAQVSAGPAGSLNTSTTLTNRTDAGNVVTERDSFTSGSVAAGSVVTFDFDFYIDASGGSAYSMMGVGSSTTVPVLFGSVSRSLFVREENFGANHFIKDGVGNLVLSLDSWYTVRLVMDLSANEGSGAGELYLKDLTAGVTMFTQLYFDTAQSITAADLGISTDETLWTTAYARLGDNGGGPNYIDNTKISVIPEYSTLAYLLGMIPLCLCTRRRMKR
jgi:hypothetical protein